MSGTPSIYYSASEISFRLRSFAECSDNGCALDEDEMFTQEREEGPCGVKLRIGYGLARIDLQWSYFNVISNAQQSR